MSLETQQRTGTGMNYNQKMKVYWREVFAQGDIYPSNETMGLSFVVSSFCATCFHRRLCFGFVFPHVPNPSSFLGIEHVWIEFEFNQAMEQSNRRLRAVEQIPLFHLNLSQADIHYQATVRFIACASLSETAGKLRINIPSIHIGD